MPDEDRKCKHPYVEWDPDESDFVDKRCPHPYFGPGKNRKGEEIDCCIFHASINAKKNHEEQFWSDFEDLFARAKKAAEAAEVEEDKAKVWLECFGFIFPDTYGRFYHREFPFSLNTKHAHFSGDAGFYRTQFSGDAGFYRAQFSGDADFGYARFSGDADFWDAQFSGDAYFHVAKFSGDADFHVAKFSGDADFTRAQFSGAVLFWLSEITQGKFNRVDIKGFNFLDAIIGEFAQTAEYEEKAIEKGVECKFQNIKTLKPVGSADFSGVKYNAQHKHLFLLPYSIPFAVKWLIKRVRKVYNKDVSLPNFDPPSRYKKYKRTGFIGVDTSAVDWSKNPALGRDIRYQQFLHQFWGRNFGTKVFYFFWWVTSRCGESIWRWLFWAFALITVFGIFYAGYPAPVFLPDCITNFLIAIRPYFSLTMDNFFDPYYLSAITFTTLGLGNIEPLNLPAQILLVIEVMFGFTMLGALISFFANKFIRRE